MTHLLYGWLTGEWIRPFSAHYADSNAAYQLHSRGMPVPTSAGDTFVSLSSVVPPDVVRSALAQLSQVVISRNERTILFPPFDDNQYVVRFYRNADPQILDRVQIPDVVRKLMTIALRRFGTELKLDGDHLLRMSLIQYNIPSSGLNAFKWHSDYKVSWTMISLLTDPNNLVSGWRGGELSHSSFFSEGSRIFQPVDSIRTMGYRQYDALLFYNFNCLHRVEAMYPRGSLGNRIILQISLLGKENKLGHIDPMHRHIPSDHEVTARVRELSP